LAAAANFGYIRLDTTLIPCVAVAIRRVFCMTVNTVFDPLEALPEHETWLRTSLLARLGSRDEVEEVMQEVAVAAANQSAKAERIERVGPWLYRVAMRQMLLFRRKAGRQRKLLGNVAQACQPTEEDKNTRSPLEFLMSQERQREVRQAMVTLSERDRQLLLLKYVEGLSYGDIAKRIGVTPSAVQSRLHRARGMLRNRLTSMTTGNDSRPDESNESDCGR
jgi:RNA polymerase sigma factor (sigma-70 family)